MKGVLTHELGHVLGLRHEHTRPEAGKCFEDNNWRALTTYDAHSVMHYPQCNGLNTGDLVLTAEDKKGIALLYGQPVNNNEPDNILPVVTISSPQNNEQVSSNFTIISNASDNRGITKVEFYINNQKVGEKDVAPYSYNITNASPGATLIILVKAFDAAGNIGSSETIIVSVSNSFQCKEFTSTNIQHIAAGRAEKYNYLYSEYTRTIGAKESLGIVGTTWYSPTSTVKETAPGYFAKGSCK
jgi:hypothetical protein